MRALRHRSTARLQLDAPTEADIPRVHEITSDPRVWEHYPSLRHTERAQTASMVARWQREWSADGLGVWIVRDAEAGTVLGYCGCAIWGGAVWNLGYRFAPEAQGRGYATEVAALAIEAAREVRAELPIVAYLVEHNVGSRGVAERVGLELRHRAPDRGNPDPAVMRLVLADRALAPHELEAALA